MLQSVREFYRVLQSVTGYYKDKSSASTRTNFWACLFCIMCGLIAARICVNSVHSAHFRCSVVPFSSCSLHHETVAGDSPCNHLFRCDKIPLQLHHARYLSLQTRLPDFTSDIRLSQYLAIQRWLRAMREGLILTLSICFVEWVFGLLFKCLFIKFPSRPKLQQQCLYLRLYLRMRLRSQTPPHAVIRIWTKEKFNDTCTLYIED